MVRVTGGNAAPGNPLDRPENKPQSPAQPSGYGAPTGGRATGVPSQGAGRPPTGRSAPTGGGRPAGAGRRPAAPGSSPVPGAPTPPNRKPTPAKKPQPPAPGKKPAAQRPPAKGSGNVGTKPPAGKGKLAKGAAVKEAAAAETVADETETSSTKPAKTGFFAFKHWTMNLLVMRSVALLVVLALIAGGVWWFANQSPKSTIDENRTGAIALQTYVDAARIGNAEGLAAAVGGSSYMADEYSYAGDSEERRNMVSAVLSTLSVTIPEVPVLKGNGEQVVKDDVPQTEVDNLMAGGKVTYSHIDYSKIELTKEMVDEALAEFEVDVASPNIKTELTDAFAQFLTKLIADKNIELATLERSPSIQIAEDGVEGDVVQYAALKPDEDIFLDQLLFSSPEFWDLQDEFSTLALGELPKSEEYVKYEEEVGPEETEAPSDTASPEATGGTEPAPDATAPADETSELDGLGAPSTESPAPTGSTELTESAAPEVLRPPLKWNSHKSIDRNWIGAYYLKVVVAGEDPNAAVLPQQGDGTKADTAGIGTTISTKYMDGDKEVPVEVTLVNVLRDQDAFSLFAERDARNRGFTMQSSVRYVYLEFRVTNLSNEEMNLSNRATLATGDGNPNRRTGTVFGLAEAVKIAPGETKTLETWTSSSSIDTLYLIWQGFPDKKIDNIWFRLFAGDPNAPAPTETPGGTEAPAPTEAPEPTPTP